ncbi:hypothetical protein GPECTOR_18g140 [Gonium pectorale]|uniref:Uncharacterized protein n=1 Tax=Gonium pectorale TaxID=33097 RepID=A0A150GJX3_GONPE|nr:hypothetical protein GPECTOR_18g140 [Gonium pectorale]|eukprot:KXZ49985.1 hypothetical protein GPECTOR_18g140 [Gonium pectorale]
MPGPAKRSSLGLYYTNAEGDFFGYATYYGLQMISLKAAVYHQMRAGARGFQVHALRYETRDNASSDPAALFYEDAMHPSGLTGHRRVALRPAIAELVIGLLLTVARGLVTRPWRQSEAELVRAPLPAHMIPDNRDSAADSCLMGERLAAAAMEATGFSWINEGRNPAAPKWGFTATAPGASIAFNLSAIVATTDPRVSASASDPWDGAAGVAGTAGEASAAGAEADGAAAGRRLVLVMLAYLRSYENMGQAHVTCEGGCVCGEAARREGDAGAPSSDQPVAVLDGHWAERTSQLQLSCFPARLGPALALGSCVVRVAVGDHSRSGAYKVRVKLGALMVSHTSPKLAQTMCAVSLEAAQRAAGYRVR